MQKLRSTNWANIPCMHRTRLELVESVWKTESLPINLSVLGASLKHCFILQRVYRAWNANKMEATNTTNAKLNGKYDFQSNCINWSYRIRGNVARTQINTNTKNAVFNPNQNAGDKGNKDKG